MGEFCVIIDNGHGRETPGKRSPDGRLLEWRWTRDVAIQLKNELEKRGITATLLVPEDTDVPLATRVARANAIDKLCSDSILVSIHVNAAPTFVIVGQSAGAVITDVVFKASKC